ncbi:hypothetical protein JYU20_02685 [Bacteroidales bacterium AH-315-I05]|nr:hypothetical protein [Bacteroidales bacterium AH-315-I05]
MLSSYKYLVILISLLLYACTSQRIPNKQEEASQFRNNLKTKNDKKPDDGFKGAKKTKEKKISDDGFAGKQKAKKGKKWVMVSMASKKQRAKK